MLALILSLYSVILAQDTGAKVAFDSPTAPDPKSAKLQQFSGAEARIVRPLPGGLLETLSPSHVFKGGETVQLKVRPDLDGLLVLFVETSKDNYAPIFPHPRFYNGSAKVRKGEEITIPLTFDSNPSDTKLYLAVLKSDADKQFIDLAKSKDAKAPPYREVIAYVNPGGKKGLIAPEKIDPAVLSLKTSDKGLFAEFTLKNK